MASGIRRISRLSIVALLLVKAHERRHLHPIGTDGVIGAVATVADGCTGDGEELPGTVYSGGIHECYATYGAR
jgi:hypothetical protein